MSTIGEHTLFSPHNNDISSCEEYGRDFMNALSSLVYTQDGMTLQSGQGETRISLNFFKNTKYYSTMRQR